ncbi:CgeB family protein [Butyrivibrio fibrisolvens]|uniref:CgeB family protein n=1 Tax=Butyrivibrio fibrisolvens TaxID=831 RepID=UPI0003FFB0F3|nr:glycosyltransferase [Butyrivibrio fibrisolvens]
MIRILFIELNSIGNEDIYETANAMTYYRDRVEIVKFPFDINTDRNDKAFISNLKEKLSEDPVDFVMSFNYWPVISTACNEVGIKYAAWVYDNPAVNLFSHTLINPCNYVFLFDSQMYELFAGQGINTVYYLPMAAAVPRYDRITVTEDDRKKWGGNISFVGGMYTEGHNFYDRIEDKLSDYSKGYLQGLMDAQMQIYGFNFIERTIPEKVMEEMVDVLGLKPNVDGVESYEYLYGNYVINRKITAIERCDIVKKIGKKFGINLFTRDESFGADGVSNRGRVDYYDEMPYVFKTSDINLNITLRSIQSGIPLRAMDIMGCRGFLLTNYQEDLLRFFEPGKDFVYYESQQDLMEKIDYYLEHEDERRQIAGNGYEKVKRDHTYALRLAEIIDTVL